MKLVAQVEGNNLVWMRGEGELVRSQEEGGWGAGSLQSSKQDLKIMNSERIELRLEKKDRG